MSIFPFFGDEGVEESTQYPVYSEVAWDFKNNRPVIENGNFKIVPENEAIKSWCYRTLQINRYSLEIYTWDYASELEKLIGTPYSESLARSECVRYVEECLMVNPYIIGLSNIEVDFKDGLLTVNCDLETIYGSDSLEEVNVGV